jgi:lipoate-protein ligase B
MDYKAAYAVQQETHKMRMNNLIPDTLLTVEHPSIYTIGRSGYAQGLRIKPDALKQMGIEVLNTDRGGSITYHGPGQLVVYPVININVFNNDCLLYLRFIEEIIIKLLYEFGIQAKRFEPYTGVWVENKKIAAVGVSVNESVTMHGFSINVNPNLEFFDYIYPCGIKGYGVTSMKNLLSSNLGLVKVKKVFKSVVSCYFDSNIKMLNKRDLINFEQYA